MPFDTSNVAATVGQGVNQFNPLQTIGNLASLQNAMNQNRLFQAQQAVGAAAQQAVDPQTGAFDPSAANKLIAGNPGASVAAPAALAANLSYADTAQSLAARRQAAIQATAGPLMTAPNLTPADVRRSISVLRDNGVITPDNAAVIAGSMPSDPKQLRGYLADTFGLPNLGAQGALNATVPTPTPTSFGGSINPVTPAPQISAESLNGPPGAGGVPSVVPPAAMTVGSGVATTLGPASAGELVPIVDPNTHMTHLVPKSSIEGPTGAALPGVSPPVAALAPETAAALGQAGAATGAQSGQYFAAIHNAAIQAPAQVASLAELQSLVNDPNVKTGPASPFLSKVNGLAQQFGIPINKDWESDTSKLDVFGKIATQIAQQKFGVIGGTGTDAKLMSAAHTSPDQMISSLSNKDIIPLLRGDAAAAQHIDAAANAWMAAGNGPTTGPQFQAALVQHHYNPLVFQLQYMDPAERTKIVAGLDKGDQGKYKADWEYALQKGWITP